MGKGSFIKILILILVLLSFFSDWGFFYSSVRPTISFPEIGAMIFIIFWLLGKFLRKGLKISPKSLQIFFLIFSIFLVATIGAILHFDQISLSEHLKSSVKLIFWAIFMFCWVNAVKSIFTDIKFSNRVWTCYLNCALVISGITIFQYIFHQFTGQHLNLNPFLKQSWGVIGGYYRATGIYREPSWLGVVLIPPLIAQGKLFFTKNKVSYLWKFLFLVAGVLVSLSLANFIVLGIWGVFIFLKWIYQELSIFFKIKVKRNEFQTISAIFFLLIIVVFIIIQWIFPLVLPRIQTEFNAFIYNFKYGAQILTSGAKRFASYEGFVAILKRSPLFGVGFDQRDYVSYLVGKYFESTTSGIFGFIGTSAGLIGIILFLYMLKFIWNGGEKKKIKIREKNQPDLLLIGRAIVVALLLEQIFLYAGILNADFWIPLAFAYLFVKSGQLEVKKENEK